MKSLRFNVYLRYKELQEALETLSSAYPHLMQLISVGQSYEGREIWLAKVTNFATGDDTDKPAFYVDGNIHATEVTASMACLYFLHHLVTGYGHDANVTHCLDSRVFYVCPRLNPDGAEYALADVPRFIRSSTRPYPYAEEPLGGLRREDIDGDGRVLTMRIPDANGPWKISDLDPRLMVRREPAEIGGQYYRLLPEGLIDDFDGVTLKLQERRQKLDLNRNYPAHWRQEHEQEGAGPYPTSEPEVRAAVRFISDHPNITGAVTFHTYSGVLLRPYAHRADDTLPAEDLWTYQKIGAEGTKHTGYPHISVYHEFRYHPKQVITGAFDDWIYDHLGCFAWTVEIWCPQREAGIAEFQFIDWYREHPVEDELKLLSWNDEVLGGDAFVAWYPFEHPQLGPIELGGWNSLFSWINPPPALLEREIAKFPDWLTWHLLISPRLELKQLTSESLGERTWRITLVVENTGWLPTYVCKRALEINAVRGILCEIELPDDAEMLLGQRRETFGQLEGRAYTPATSSSWAGWGGDTTDQRLKVAWVVRASPGCSIRVSAQHQRAGVLRSELILG